MMITEPKALAVAADQVAGADLPEARGVIVAAFGDPGALALSQRLTCPVIGIGAAAAHRAVIGRAPFGDVHNTA